MTRDTRGQAGPDPRDWRAIGVVPVVTLARADLAVPLAETLVDAGLPVIEVTLRTPAALEAIRLVAAEVPAAVVGAGTIRRPADLDAAVSAGARFLVSPGATDELLNAAEGHAAPYLPGCATPSEAMRLADRGFATVKFFPASSYGGAATLKALSAPLAGLAFVPTGGIGPDDLAAYLSLANVIAVGGSWMVRPAWIEEGRFAEIGNAARAASAAAGACRRPVR